MNRRNVLHAATVGLAGVPLAGAPALASAEPDPPAGPLINLLDLGLTAGDTDDNATGNTAAWERATTQAAATGGSVHLPGAGVYRFTGGLNLDSNVRYVSDGATLKLANGANVDLLHTRGFDGLWGSTSRSGPSHWSLAGFVLDGNAANQSAACFPLSIFGRAFTLERLRITNGSGGGIRSANGSGGSLMEARLHNLTVYNNRNIQFDWRGPNDSQMSDIIVFTDWAFHGGAAVPGSRGMRFSENSPGTQVDRLHIWGFHEVGLDVTCGYIWIYNGVSEGAQINVWLNASNTVFAGDIFGTKGTGPYAGSEVGYRVGTAGSGLTHWNNRLQATLTGWAATDRPIDLAADNGTNIDATFLAAAATQAVYGTRSFKSVVNIMCPDQPHLSERAGGFSGTGAPNAKLGVVGSMYTRLDGGTGSYLYRKTSPSAWTPIL